MHTASAKLHRLDWSDFQYVLAVAEQRSLAGAARAMKVNHSTVLRRIADFEKQLGVRLFERLPTGYVLTSAGEELAAAARDVQERIVSIERSVVGRDLRLTGSVRVTTTDTLAAELVPRALAAFSSKHPQLQLELSTTTLYLNLTKRDADVAVRPTRRPPPNLVGRRVAPLGHALYAAPSYLKRVPAKRPLTEHVWLAPDDSLAGTTIARWMQKELGDAPIALRADTLTSLCRAAVMGLGVVALPCFLGDQTAQLRRIRGVIPEMEVDLWVLTHEDLRSAARIRALTDALVEALAEQRALLEGRSPRG
ncbi:MAG TPA: LysR family transcriptional regulator [Polyangiaceae bacterium]